MMIGRTTRLRPTAMAVLTASWMASTTAVFAQGNPNPGSGIVPPGARVLGKTYGEWGAAWWTWAYRIPAATNPVSDPTGEFCHEGQSGPVFFLAGNFGG